MPYVYSPVKPADGDMMPWAHAATTADDPCAASTYIPLVRAINERCKAANRPLIPEDSLMSWFNAAAFGTPTPADGQWQTLGGMNVVQTGIGPSIISHSSGLIVGFSVNPSWEITEQNIVQSVSTNISGQSVVVSVPIVDTAQTIYARPITGSHTGTSNMQATAWTPTIGDTFYFQTGGVAYPAEWQAPLWGYATLQRIIATLLIDYVDVSFEPDGKDGWDVAAAFEGYRLLYNDTYGGIVTPLPNNYFFGVEFNSAIPLFYTTGGQWPPKTPPTGWLAGRPYGGFTRKREREITTLSDPGVGGQLARFIYSALGQGEDGIDGTLAPFHPPTPSTERQYSCKVMFYTGTAWVESASGFQPDEVTFIGFAQRGDKVGPWIINELKAAINALTTTLVEPFIWPGFYFNTDTGAWEGDLTYSEGHDEGIYGHIGTWANATGNYGSYPLPLWTSGTNFDRGKRGPSSGGLLGAPAVGLLSGVTIAPPFGDNYELSSNSARLYVFQHACPFARTIKFYYHTLITGYDPDWYTFDSGGFTAAWSAYNPMAADGSTDTSSVYNGKINLLWETPSPTSDDHVNSGVRFGLAPSWTTSEPLPNTDLSSPNYGHGRRAFSMTLMNATCNWDVAGGFKYSSTPRGGV